MSALAQEIEAQVQEIINTSWSIRDGQVIPKTKDVVLKNGAVRVDATYLYADLGDSSGAAQKLKKEVTGKIIRTYLDAASRIIKHFDGAIRSFDGDRVMGVFIGGVLPETTYFVIGARIVPRVAEGWTPGRERRFGLRDRCPGTFPALVRVAKPVVSAPMRFCGLKYQPRCLRRISPTTYSPT